MEFLVLLAVLFVCVITQNLVYQKCTFRHLSYRCFFSKDEVFEGESLELVEELENRKWLPIPWLKTEITASKHLDFAGAQSVVTGDSRFVPSFFMVKSYHKVQRRWKVTCLKRGVYAPEQIILVATDLLGNVTVSRSAGPLDASVTVLPRPASIAPLPISSRYLMGDEPVRRRMIPDPFYVSGIREYTGAESMKQIHWQATAREQKLMVFQNEDTALRKTCVILNLETSCGEEHCTLFPKAAERAIRGCAAVLDQTLRRGLPFQLFVNGARSGLPDCVPTGTMCGSEAIMGCLRLLSGLDPKCHLSFDVFLNRISASVSASDLVIITPYPSEGLSSFVLRKKTEGIGVCVLWADAVDTHRLPDCPSDSIEEAPESEVMAG